MLRGPRSESQRADWCNAMRGDIVKRCEWALEAYILDAIMLALYLERRIGPSLLHVIGDVKT
jgi:hypothetical protein